LITRTQKSHCADENQNLKKVQLPRFECWGAVYQMATSSAKPDDGRSSEEVCCENDEDEGAEAGTLRGANAEGGTLGCGREGDAVLAVLEKVSELREERGGGARRPRLWSL
jgi:hypothetical protein